MPYTTLDAHAEPAFSAAHCNCWVPSHEKLLEFVDFLRWHRPSIFNVLVFERRRANNTEQSDLIKTSESASGLRAAQHSAINHRLQSKSCASWCSFLHNIYCRHVNAWTALNKPICHFKSVVFAGTTNSSRTKDMFGNDIINIDSFKFFSSFVF